MVKNNPDFAFPSPSYEEWLDIARQELEGADPLKKLSLDKGSLIVKPYYQSSSDNSQLDFTLKPASNPYYGARGWLNTPRIPILDEKQANELALHFLNTGADGILFEPLKANIQFGTLLHQIKPDYCSLSFLIRNDVSINTVDLLTWAANNKVTESVTGCIFQETPLANAIDTLKNYNSSGIIVHTQKNAEDEIVAALEKSVHVIESMPKQGHVESLIEQVAFYVSVGSDFFLEIAKLRALRNLWYQVQGAYGLAKIKPVHIHSTSSVWNKEEFQPHGNMINSTLCALSAILGGCDSLTIEPEDQDNVMMGRIARNVSSILREESYLSKVADPVAGSYYLDSLVAELSDKAWQKFQTKMQG
jgi:methylmalonyl-CoA mutase